MTKTITIGLLALAFVAGSIITGGIVFAAGVDGAKGDQGDPGAKGDQGEPGAKGDQGEPGVDARGTIFGFGNGRDFYTGGSAVLGHGAFSYATTDLVPYDGTMKNLYVAIVTIDTSGSIKFEVQIADAGTNIITSKGPSCTITLPANTCTNTTTMSPMTAGQPFRIVISSDDTFGGVGINAGVEFTNS